MPSKRKVQAADLPEVDEAAGGEDSDQKLAQMNKGISKVDLAMRVVAAIATLGSAVALATTNQSAPIFSEFSNFKAQFRDFPSFTFFMVMNCIACGYLVLSLALSVFHIFKSTVRVTRLVLIICDTLIMALLLAGASAAAAVVQLADKGNAHANWIAVCHMHNSFCERVSGSLAGSFLGILLLLMLIVMTAIAVSRH